MPRVARILPDIGVFHILVRGNNRQPIFKADADFKAYLKLLKDYKTTHECLVYHYVLMNNHLHLVLETTAKSNLSKMMQGINLSYVYYYRRKYGYFGHFFQDRYKSLLIEKDRYLLACGRYIELNPVRAKLVRELEDYPWSSYRIYAYGEKSPWVDIDPLYKLLGQTVRERQKAYQELMVDYKEEKEVQQSLRGHFYGSDQFVKQMEAKFGVSNVGRKRGRLRKRKL